MHRNTRPLPYLVRTFPHIPPISDQPNVRPVARFGVPRDISLEEMIFRKLDQIATSGQNSLLEMRLIQSQVETRIHNSTQMLSKQHYDSTQRHRDANHNAVRSSYAAAVDKVLEGARHALAWIRRRRRPPAAGTMRGHDLQV